MKVNIIKDHPNYKGVVDVTDERGAYLISMGVAEKYQPVKEKKEGGFPDKKNNK